jgi:hypothetical protein
MGKRSWIIQVGSMLSQGSSLRGERKVSVGSRDRSEDATWLVFGKKKTTSEGRQAAFEFWKRQGHGFSPERWEGINLLTTGERTVLNYWPPDL